MQGMLLLLFRRLLCKTEERWKRIYDSSPLFPPEGKMTTRSRLDAIVSSIVAVHPHEISSLLHSSSCFFFVSRPSLSLSVDLLIKCFSTIYVRFRGIGWSTILLYLLPILIEFWGWVSFISMPFLLFGKASSSFSFCILFLCYWISTFCIMRHAINLHPRFCGPHMGGECWDFSNICCDYEPLRYC